MGKQSSARRQRCGRAALLCAAFAVLAGCGGGTPAARATVGIEEEGARAQALPVGASGADEVPAAGAHGADEVPAADETAPAAAVGTAPGSGEVRVPFTYWDGDDQVTVYLVAEPSEAQAWAQDGAAASDAASALSRATDRRLPPASWSSAETVFETQSGIEMSLPGGVILMLDPEWSPQQAAAFFAEHGIEPRDATEMSWIDNGFVVDADPGVGSLLLANSLVGQPGVVMSAPDWAFELEVK